MRLINLKLAGFGAHSNTEIDFTQLAGQVAYCAPLGTGKTFLFEAPFACLWGSFIWYQGSIYDALTQGGTGEGTITLTFCHDDRHYLAERIVKDTGKTKTQRASLYDAAGDAIAGPNVRDFQAAIDAMIYDADTAKATSFLSQNRAGDLVGQPGEPDLVARRRAIFNELIGASDLDRLEARSGEVLRKTKTTIEILESQLVGETDPADEIETERTLLAAGERDLAATRERLGIARQQLEAAHANLRDSQGGDDVLRAQMLAYESATDGMLFLSGDINTMEDRAGELLKKAESIETERAAAVRLEALTGGREVLRRADVQYKAWSAWKTEAACLDQRVESTRRELAATEATPGADAETVALAGRLDEIKRKGVDAKAENEARERRNRKRQMPRDGLRDRINLEESQVKSYAERLDKKPVTPFGDGCAPCPFMREFTELPTRLKMVKLCLERDEKERAEIPDDEPLTDLSELRAEYERANAAASLVKGAEVARQAVAHLKTSLAMAERDRASHESLKVSQADDPSDGIAANQREIDGLAGAPDRLAACRAAQADHTVLVGQIAEAKVTMTTRTAEAEALRIPAESAKATLADRETQRQSLTDAVAENEQSAKVLSNEADALTGIVAKHGARIEGLDRRRDEQRAKRGQLAALRTKADAVADNRACWGPHGVRQILIDDAAPELETIAADLFEQATGGRMRMRIATQKVNSDGTIAEDFKILIRDSAGERDALRYSGGQLQLILIIFRVAVAIWSARLRGASPDSLYLDEACDRLGAEGTEDLFRVLDYLRDRFRQIVIVTHDVAIAERMQSHVRLTGGIGGVSVEVCGQVTAA